MKLGAVWTMQQETWSKGEKLFRKRGKTAFCLGSETEGRRKGAWRKAMFGGERKVLWTGEKQKRSAKGGEAIFVRPMNVHRWRWQKRPWATRSQGRVGDLKEVAPADRGQYADKKLQGVVGPPKRRRLRAPVFKGAASTTIKGDRTRSTTSAYFMLAKEGSDKLAGEEQGTGSKNAGTGIGKIQIARKKINEGRDSQGEGQSGGWGPAYALGGGQGGKPGERN